MTELEKKLWKRVQRYGRFLAFLPYLKLVAVCNNLAFGKVDRDSDIDLFIIAGRGRLFSARIFVTILLQLLGVRRHGKKIAGRFCLSFFIDESQLNLSKIAIESDIYLAYWVSSMKPIIDDGVFDKFLQSNRWTEDFFDNDTVMHENSIPLFDSKNWFKKLLEKFFSGKFGDWFEAKMKSWQLKRALNKAKLADGNASLVISENMLKFHNVDRRREYRNRWFNKYGERTLLNRERFLDLESY